LTFTKYTVAILIRYTKKPNEINTGPRGEIGRHKGLKIYQSIKILTPD